MSPEVKVTKTTREYDLIVKAIIRTRNSSELTLTSADVLPFNDMSDSLKAACSGILRFITDYPHEPEFPFETKNIVPELNDRILASKLFMYWLCFDTNVPAYSSYLMEKSVEAIRRTQGSGGKEILLALIEMIHQYDIKAYNPSSEYSWAARTFVVDLCKALGWRSRSLADLKNDCHDIIDTLIASLNTKDIIDILVAACWLHGTFGENPLPETYDKILEEFTYQDHIWEMLD